MLLAHFLAVVVLIVALVRMVPEFLRLFKEFDADMPTMTQLVIRLSGIVVQYWYLLVPLVLVVDAAVLFGLRLLPGKAKGLSTAWAVLVLVTAILLLGFIILSLVLPLQALIADLS
jgi:type II secretory pathway component PulF